MCPPSPTPPDAIGLDCTDKDIILSLDKFIHGSPPPTDVLEDVNPYQNQPLHLPPKMWYLVNSTGPKESKHGFWKAKGDACEIFENPVIQGWKTTLEFFEGHVPHGQKTEWVMQEYRITWKGAQKENQKRSRALCRVFHCCDGSPNADRESFSNSVPLVVPNTNSTSGRDSTTESQTKSNTVGTRLPEVHKTENLCDESITDNISNGNFLELNDLDEDTGQLPEVCGVEYPSDEDVLLEVCRVEHPSDEDVLFGDYLELDDLDEGIRKSPVIEKPKSPLYEDLADPISRGAYMEFSDHAEFASHTSSSANSSHRKSDEFSGLLRDRDDEKSQDLQGKGSGFHRNVMGSVRPNEVILRPAPSELIISGTRSESQVETQSASSAKEKSSDKTIKDPNVKRPKPEYRNEGPSNASSSRHRKKKFKKYFCFLPF